MIVCTKYLDSWLVGLPARAGRGPLCPLRTRSPGGSEEVSRRYSEVSGEVDEDTYRHSARQSLERMGPDDHREFGRQLHEHARDQGYDTGFGSDADERRYEDPGRLAEMTTRVHQQNPGILGQLLGGGGGGGLGGLLGGVGGGAGGTGNPVAKAGIAAYAAKQLMNRR